MKPALPLCCALHRNWATPKKPPKGKALSFSPKQQTMALLRAVQWHFRLPCCCRVHRQEQKAFLHQLLCCKPPQLACGRLQCPSLADDYELFLSAGHLRDLPSSGAHFLVLSSWCLFRGKQASNEPALPPAIPNPSLFVVDYSWLLKLSLQYIFVGSLS